MKIKLSVLYADKATMDNHAQKFHVFSKRSKLN
jgi:hypothetical protein